jgi:nitrile hydratase subunit beta
MNGAHDLGGMMGLGPINPPRSEPVFHEPWEARMFGLMMAVGDVGGWTLDADRAACENMHPAHYLSSTYYEHWLHGLGLLLGKYTPAEPVTPTKPGDVWKAAHSRGSYIREVDKLPLFAVGQQVRVKIMNPLTHTRAPRYVRGCVGEIVALRGAHVFPDDNAIERGENPQPLYGVKFTAEALWGKSARDLVQVDLWESYLEPL